MATRSDGMGKYLQIYMMMEGLEMQRQQAEMQKMQLQQTAMQILPELAKSLREPELFANNAPGIGEALGLESNLVANFLRSAAPGSESQRTTAIGEGMRRMAPDQLTGLLQEAAGAGLAGQTRGGLAESDFMADLIRGADMPPDLGRGLAEAWATRQATGQDVGDYTISRAVSRMPEGDLSRVAEISTGLRETEAQRASRVEGSRQFDASLGQNAYQFGETHKLNIAGHNLSEFVAKNNSAYQQASTIVEAGKSGANNVADLIRIREGALTERRQLLQEIYKQRTKIDSAMRPTFILLLNANAATLRQTGANIPDLPMEADIGAPGFVEGLLAPFGVQLK